MLFGMPFYGLGAPDAGNADYTRARLPLAPPLKGFRPGRDFPAWPGLVSPPAVRPRLRAGRRPAPPGAARPMTRDFRRRRRASGERLSRRCWPTGWRASRGR